MSDATTDDIGFTLDERTAMSQAFSAGNYANAYDTTSLARAWLSYTQRDGVKHYECRRAAFVLGFFSSYELTEMVGSDRAMFDQSYNSPAGQYVVNVAKYTDDRTDEYAAEAE